MDDHIDVAENAHPRHRAASFVCALSGSDRVAVHTLNALGEYDSAMFSPDEASLALAEAERAAWNAAIEAAAGCVEDAHARSLSPSVNTIPRVEIAKRVRALRKGDPPR